MRRAILGAAFLSVALTFAGGAAAHNTSFETTILLAGTAGFVGDDRVLVIGHLEAERKACLRGRTVELTVQRNGETKVLDTDRSSRKGAWATRGAIASGTSPRARVLRKNIGPRRHRHICAGDSVAIKA